MKDSIARWAELASLEDIESNLPLFDNYALDPDTLISSLAFEKIRRIRGGKAPSVVPSPTQDTAEILSFEGFDGSLQSFVVKMDAYQSGSLEFQPPALSIVRFPQADSVDRVLRIAKLYLAEDHSSGLSPLEWNLTERQWKYYIDAALSLGLLTKSKESSPRTFTASDFSRDIFSATGIDRVVKICAIFGRDLRFHGLMEDLLVGSSSTGFERFCHSFDKSLTSSGLSQSTQRRRLQTLSSWGKWLVALFEDLLRLGGRPHRYSLVTSRQVLALAAYHAKLTKRERLTLDRHKDLLVNLDKHTLEQLGNRFDLSRERIRQLQKEELASAHRFLREDLESDDLSQISKELMNRKVVNLYELARSSEYVNSDTLWASHFLLRHFGFETNDEAFPNYLQSFELIRQEVTDLTELLPLNQRDIKAFDLVAEYGIACFMKMSAAFGHPLVERDGMLYQSKTLRRDLVLWNLRNSGPMEIAPLMEKTGEENPAAYAEFLRRLPDVKFDFGIRRWVISNHDSIESKKSLFDVIFDVVEAHGPMTINEIQNAIDGHYPVSRSRIVQAMDDGRFGKNEDGRYELLARGAVRTSEVEPNRPPNVLMGSDIISILMLTNLDHLRGSGFSIPSWVGWMLKLRSTPQSRSFISDDLHLGTFTITRRGGQYAASSIRKQLNFVGARVDCRFKIDLDLASMTWALTHLCCE